MNTLAIAGKRLTYLRLGTGAPLVLVHGFPLDHSIWEPVIPFLTDCFDLILPDLPGFGGSDSPEPDPVIEAYAHALVDLLSHLGVAQTFLAGHSMGGYVALAFARLYPHLLRGLALIASQTLADTPERKASRYATAEQVAAQGAGVIAEAMVPKLSADPAHRPVLSDLILRQKPEAIIAGLHAMAGRPDSSSLLSSLNVPLVLVHGQADALISVERAREAAQMAPHAVLVELPEVGHMPMMEAPEQTAAALKRLTST
jgi:3-oxoadipate enol-lactonase